MTEILTQPPVQELPPLAEIHKECSVQDVVKILIGSFRFSQGDSLLQKSLLSLVAWNNRGRISPDTIKEAFPIARDAANKIIRNSQLHTVTGDASSQVLEFAEYFSKSLDSSPPHLDFVTRSLINRDCKFLGSRSGRDRSEGERVTPANDPYLSHFIYYGLLGNSTGTPEYDQIFQQLTDTYKKQSEEIAAKCREDKVFIETMFDTYITHHPEQADAVRSAIQNTSEPSVAAA